MNSVSEEVRVLHVDDDVQWRRVTRDLLPTIADHVIVVSERSVADGLRSLRSSEPDPDCIVSDYAMPRRDGLEFLERVREEHPEVPFILFTGRRDAEIANAAVSAGVTDYLQKGSGIDSYRLLANRIENAVAKRRAETERRRAYEALEVAREGISLLDEAGEFAYVNRAYATLYGYEPEEMVGEHWSLVYPDGEVDRVVEEILPVVDDGRTWRGETTGLRKDGTTFREDHALTRRADGCLICSVREIAPVRELAE